MENVMERRKLGKSLKGKSGPREVGIIVSATSCVQDAGHEKCKDKQESHVLGGKLLLTAIIVGSLRLPPTDANLAK
jgi:hypothetical protein